MLYYRRKILLALLDVFGGSLGKIELQKLLFLLCHTQQKPSFEFLPYHYGCYSYQSIWDLKSLIKYGYIKEFDNCFSIEKQGDYQNMIDKKDLIQLKYLEKKYKYATSDDLMKLTYQKFPYYAIKSKKATQLLDKTEFQLIQEQIPHSDKTILFTLGYEGISLEKYFNKLIINDVKVLCDVRRNPISQKVGFSKPTLQKVSASLGILYVHIPELGIEGEKRQSLNTQKDYDILFADYEQNQLKYQDDYLKKIIDLLLQYQRVALTCFEAAPCQCHRSKVANAITKQQIWKYELKHL